MGQAYRKTTAVVIVLSFLWTSGNVADAAKFTPQIFSNPDSLPQYELVPPPSFGRLTDYFNAKTKSNDPNNPSPEGLVILIQDLHAHYRVQKNIVGLLDFLTQKPSPSPSSSPIKGEEGQKFLSPGGRGPAHEQPSFDMGRPRKGWTGEGEGVSQVPFRIAIEGAQGPLDLSEIALDPEEKLKEKACDYLMREAELTGMDYFAAMRREPKILFGVEDMKLYHVHRDIFRKTLESRSELTRVLSRMQRDLSAARSQVYSGKLSKFQRVMDRSERGEISADEFVAALASESRTHGIDLAKLFPTIDRYYSSLFTAGSETRGNLLRRIFHKHVTDLPNPETLRKGVAAFLKATYGRFSQEEVKRLTDLAGQQNNIPYYLYLRDQIHTKGLAFAVPQELGRYLEYLHTTQTANVERLMQEGQSLSLQIKLKLAENQAQKDFVQVEHDVNLLSRMLEFKATESEVRAFGPRLSQFVALAESLLKIHSSPLAGEGRVRGNQPGSPSPQSSPINGEEELRRLVSSCIDYYVLALLRNEPLVENTLALLKRPSPLAGEGLGERASPAPATRQADSRNQHNTVVLVSGGFHTAGITQQLREKNISYVVLTPNVDQYTDQDHALYVKRMMGVHLTDREIYAAARAEPSPTARKPIANTDGIQWYQEMATKTRLYLQTKLAQRSLGATPMAGAASLSSNLKPKSPRDIFTMPENRRDLLKKVGEFIDLVLAPGANIVHEYLGHNLAARWYGKKPDSTKALGSDPHTTVGFIKEVEENPSASAEDYRIAEKITQAGPKSHIWGGTAIAITLLAAGAAFGLFKVGLALAAYVAIANLRGYWRNRTGKDADTVQYLRLLAALRRAGFSGWPEFAASQEAPPLRMVTTPDGVDRFGVVTRVLPDQNSYEMRFFNPSDLTRVQPESARRVVIVSIDMTKEPPQGFLVSSNPKVAEAMDLKPDQRTDEDTQIIADFHRRHNLLISQSAHKRAVEFIRGFRDPDPDAPAYFNRLLSGTPPPTHIERLESAAAPRPPQANGGSDRVPSDPQAAFLWAFQAARDLRWDRVSQANEFLRAKIQELNEQLTQLQGIFTDEEIQGQKATAIMPIENLAKVLEELLALQQALTTIQEQKGRLPADSEWSRKIAAKENYLREQILEMLALENGFLSGETSVQETAREKLARATRRTPRRISLADHYLSQYIQAAERQLDGLIVEAKKLLALTAIQADAGRLQPVTQTGIRELTDTVNKIGQETKAADTAGVLTPKLELLNSYIQTMTNLISASEARGRADRVAANPVEVPQESGATEAGEEVQAAIAISARMAGEAFASAKKAALNLVRESGSPTSESFNEINRFCRGASEAAGEAENILALYRSVDPVKEALTQAISILSLLTALEQSTGEVPLHATQRMETLVAQVSSIWAQVPERPAEGSPLLTSLWNGLNDLRETLQSLRDGVQAYAQAEEHRREKKSDFGGTYVYSNIERGTQAAKEALSTAVNALNDLHLWSSQSDRRYAGAVKPHIEKAQQAAGEVNRTVAEQLGERLSGNLMRQYEVDANTGVQLPLSGVIIGVYDGFWTLRGYWRIHPIQIDSANEEEEEDGFVAQRFDGTGTLREVIRIMWKPTSGADFDRQNKLPFLISYDPFEVMGGLFIRPSWTDRHLHVMTAGEAQSSTRNGGVTYHTGIRSLGLDLAAILASLVATINWALSKLGLSLPGLFRPITPSDLARVKSQTNMPTGVDLAEEPGVKSLGVGGELTEIVDAASHTIAHRISINRYFPVFSLPRILRHEIDEFAKRGERKQRQAAFAERLGIGEHSPMAKARGELWMTLSESGTWLRYAAATLLLSPWLIQAVVNLLGLIFGVAATPAAIGTATGVVLFTAVALAARAVAAARTEAADGYDSNNDLVPQNIQRSPRYQQILNNLIRTAA